MAQAASASEEMAAAVVSASPEQVAAEQRRDEPRYPYIVRPHLVPVRVFACARANTRAGMHASGSCVCAV